MRFDVVLCGTGLTPGSASALAYAAEFARWHGSRLKVLHVVADITREGAGLHDRVQEFYTRSVPETVRAAIQHEILLGEGDVADALTATAKLRDVDIVVTGFQHAFFPFSRHRFDKIAHRTGKPVLGVPAGCVVPPAWRMIVVGTDLSDASVQTRAAAAAIAEAGGGRLLAVHVVSDVPPAFAAADPLAVPAYRDFAIAEAAREMDEAFGPLPEFADVRVCSGSVSDELAGAVEREHADLLIVGLHPEGHWLAPSVADQLLDSGTCAVLAVPHTKIFAAASQA